MNAFRKIARVEEVTSHRPLRILFEDEEYVLFRTGDEVFGIRNRCPHQLFSLLHEGTLEEYILTCPMHGWKFDIRSGASVAGGGRLAPLEIQIDGNDILARLPGQPAPELILSRRP